MRKRLAHLWLVHMFVLAMVFSWKTVALAQVKDLQGTIVSTSMDSISKYGNVNLSIERSEIIDAGYKFGDVVTVSFLDKKLDIPYCNTYSDVENGETAVITTNKDTDKYVFLAVNKGDFATKYGLAEKVTGEDGSVSWNAVKGVSFPVNVTISMNTPGGYYEEYVLHHLSYTDERTDYPDLTDDEFANFREVTAGKIGKGKLYRSASPINPRYNRNTYADSAIQKAGVTVIMNLAEDEETAKSYEDFDNTYYSKQTYIPVNMSMDVFAQDSKEKFAQGLRFFVENPGTYCIHCTEGKDRTGFVCAVIECLMGAGHDEIVKDYMTTFYNYYGIKEGDEKYEYIVKNFDNNLCKAFEITDAANADLQEEAAEYIKSLGLTDKEIEALKANLSDAPAEENKTDQVIPNAAGKTVSVKAGDVDIFYPETLPYTGQKWKKVLKDGNTVIYVIIDGKKCGVSKIRMKGGTKAGSSATVTKITFTDGRTFKKKDLGDIKIEIRPYEVSVSSILAGKGTPKLNKKGNVKGLKCSMENPMTTDAEIVKIPPKSAKYENGMVIFSGNFTGTISGNLIGL